MDLVKTTAGRDEKLLQQLPHKKARGTRLCNCLGLFYVAEEIFA